MNLVSRILVTLLVYETFCLIACGTNSDQHEPITGGNAEVQGATATYAQILPILQARCLRCHNQAPFDWTKESELRKAAQSGELARRIRSRAMPQKDSPEAAAMTDRERQALIGFANGGSGAGKPASPESTSITDVKWAVLSKCMACHEANGISRNPDIPNLAGHSQGYLLKRFREFLNPGATGPMPANLHGILSEYGLTYTVAANNNVTLSPQLEDTFDSVAEFYSDRLVLPSAETFASARAKFSAAETNVYQAGQKAVADTCAACHGLNHLVPNEGIPMLFGQKANYLRHRLEEFRARATADEPVDNPMPAIASSLTPEDISAIVFYLSHTHPAEAPAP